MNNEIDDEFKAERNKDPSELTTPDPTTTSDPPSDTSEPEDTGDDTETPIDPIWFAIPLIMIPIIRRKRRK